MNKGKLYLIPNLLGGDDNNIIPNYIKERINHINEYIVENERNARRYLIKLGIQTAIDDLQFHVLDKHKAFIGIQSFLKNISKGIDVALLSDAGCPAVADPGALVVAEAHRQNIEVVPMVGPSSLLLALMGSGMNGQEFAFRGYLPIDKQARIKEIKWLDQLVNKEGSTQIFIETPYRNEKLLADLLVHCKGQSRLCIAIDLTLPSQVIMSKSIADWKKQATPQFHKRPCVFVLGR